MWYSFSFRFSDNEWILTGESNPVFKSHIPNSNDKFNIKKCQKIFYIQVLKSFKLEIKL